MEKLIISHLKFENRIEQISRFFNQSPVEEDCGEYKTIFDSELGKGVIRGIDFDHGISLMLINFKASRDIIFDHRFGRRHPILFIYNSESEISLEQTNHSSAEIVGINEAAIFTSTGDSNYSISFTKNRLYKLVIISVIRMLFLRKIECDIETIPDVLQQVFKDTAGRDYFFYKTFNENKYINSIEDLILNEQLGLERKLLMEAKSIEYITQLIKRYRLEKDASSRIYSFKKSDIVLINEAKNLLLDHLVNPPTIKNLSKLIGMSQNKLQEGFQLVFRKSIRQFIIAARMQKALQLLNENNHNISEIAYLVGYQNKGHFSKVFKKEIGFLPSEYRKPKPTNSL